MKGISPPLRDVPRCNGMPSLKVDYESVNYASQEEMYKQNGDSAFESITAERRNICLQQ